MKTRIKNAKSKDALDEIICENLDKFFGELEELNEVDSKLQEEKYQGKKKRG